MTSQISGLCCDLDVEPADQYQSYGKVTFADKFPSPLVCMVCIDQRNKIQLGFDKIIS